jgi:hypothetical protein
VDRGGLELALRFADYAQNYRRGNGAGFRNSVLSSSNPVLITHLDNLSVREVNLKHIFR